MIFTKNIELYKNRDITFDIFKGMAIILMVLGHAGCPAKNFIYLFHMAVFFIVSGNFFKEKHYENFTDAIKSIKSKLCHLFIPFVLWNGFLILVHNYLIKISIYTSNKLFLLLHTGSSYGLMEYYSLNQIIKKIMCVFLFGYGEQLGGATWFLRVLFWISVATVVGHYLLNKLIKNKQIFNVIRLFLYLGALLIGYYMYKIGFKFYNIGIMFSCAILYYLGILYSRYKDRININFYFFICSLIVLAMANYYVGGQINLASNKYPNPLILLIVSIAGYIFMLSISKVIAKINILSNILSYIGQHTINILLFHFLSFKLITYIHIILYSEPSYYLAAFPILTNAKLWWLLYSIAGVSLPLLCVFLWNLVIQSKRVS